MLDDVEADRVRATLDRSRTPELLEILLDESVDAATATTVERLIRCLEDVRVVQPLLQLIETLDAPAHDSRAGIVGADRWQRFCGRSRNPAALVRQR